MFLSSTCTIWQAYTFGLWRYRFVSDLLTVGLEKSGRVQMFQSIWKWGMSRFRCVIDQHDYSDRQTLVRICFHTKTHFAGSSSSSLSSFIHFVCVIFLPLQTKQSLALLSEHPRSFICHRCYRCFYIIFYVVAYILLFTDFTNFFLSSCTFS